MLFYDTDTKQLLIYANGKWQADRTETILVAANNSSQAAKDAADYVATGSADQTTINNALVDANPAASTRKYGKVYLFAGTYIINNSITIPNNTTLAGAGAGTLITIPNGVNANFSAIVNTDTTTGTNVTIQDLRLDGNKANQSGSNIAMNGVKLTAMGGGSGASARRGASVLNLIANNWYASGTGIGGALYLLGSSNNTLTGNSFQGNSYAGIILESGSSNNTITGNTMQGSTNGLRISASNYNSVTGNMSQGNTNGFYLATGSNNAVTGNISQGNTYGIRLWSNSYNTISGNTVSGNTTYGIFLESSSANDNNISGNAINDSGGSTTNNGIYLSGADTNNITGNKITDTSCTGSCYAINISDATSDNNYLADNTLGGGTINDASGGDTIYGGQLNSSGAYVLQASGGISLNSAATVSANLTVTSAGNVAFQKGTDYSTVGTSNNVNFGTGVLFRLTGASAQTITGIAGGTNGRILTLVNAAAQSATLKNNDTTDSSAANVIITGTGADLSIAAGASVSLVYDSSSSVWRVVGTVAGGGSGGSYVTLQGSTPGTADVGNFNINGTGIAATLQGSTSVLTPLLDVASAGTLSIGTSTATAVTIGNASSTTTVNNKLVIKPTTDTRTLGATELMTGSNTFSAAAGWTSISGTGQSATATHNGAISDTTPLAISPALSLVAGQDYQLSLTITGRTAGYVTISVGGAKVDGYLVSSSSTISFTALANGNLTFVPYDSTFDGTITGVSLKQYNAGLLPASFTVTNASNVAAFELRVTSASANTFLGLNSGQRNLSGVYNTAVGSSSLQSNTWGNCNTVSGD